MNKEYLVKLDVEEIFPELNKFDLNKDEKANLVAEIITNSIFKKED